MTVQEFIAEHEREARFFGVTPLSRSKLRALFARTCSVGEAYGVACDVANGWTFKQAVAAMERARVARRLENTRAPDFGV